METMLREFQSALESADRVAAGALFDRALTQCRPIEAVEHLVVPALVRIGQAWHTGDLALSQVYMSGRFCEELVERVLPPSDPDRKSQPRSAIALLSDYHDLGKRIVYSVLRASGFEVFDFGRMEAGPLVDRVIAERVRVLMISVLMLPSALKVKEVVAGLREKGADVRVVVGGAPFLFDPQLWQEVGADAMGSSAAEAVTILDRLMKGLP